MGKLLDDYEDMKRIQRDRWREEAKQRGVLLCSYCGRPSHTPQGISHIGKIKCGQCQQEQLRVRFGG